MRKLALLTIITLCALHVNAQTIDTVKKTVVKPAQTRMVGGTVMSSANDVMKNLSKSKNHTTFVNLITTAGLTDAFKTPGTYTFLAPTDDAFKKLQPGLLDTLMKPAHNAELIKLLNYSIIAGKTRSTDIAKQIKANHGEASLTTLSGNTLKAKIDGNRNIVLTDENGTEAIVTQFDIAQNNGILDILNTVLMPKPGN